MKQLELLNFAPKCLHVEGVGGDRHFSGAAGLFESALGHLRDPRGMDLEGRTDQALGEHHREIDCPSGIRFGAELLAVAEGDERGCELGHFGLTGFIGGERGHVGRCLPRIGDELLRPVLCAGHDLARRGVRVDDLG